jgi:hypothetical protein
MVSDAFLAEQATRERYEQRAEVRARIKESLATDGVLHTDSRHRVGQRAAIGGASLTPCKPRLSVSKSKEGLRRLSRCRPRRVFPTMGGPGIEPGLLPIRGGSGMPTTRGTLGRN